ncbi:SDR family NAD(P)-dependent oxidoreductase [Microbacterium gorillae]|uniref:SDR family NAD(P)-dependent oxidoreductase n=1 Tax=Microbacterium gorillae TaxID=1231063 RepID=UPI00058BCE24|nr:SDR family oxidoreductase [Microbacterium gorillae]
MTGDLQGLRAVITGAAAGIGRACVDEFVARGAEVIAIDIVDAHLPAGARMVIADVSDDAAVTAAAADVLRDGGVDILVNNVGITFDGGIEAGEIADWERVFSVNVFGHVRVTRAFLPALRESDQAAIVNLASVLGVYGFRNRVLYTATKGAILSMSRAMASDLITEGIRVNSVIPGVVDTPFVADVVRRAPDPEAKRAQYDGLQATGRMVDPREIAFVIANTASPRSGSIVGASVRVDGGFGSLVG